jgi:putative tricarboxylic transport membrane protein
MSNQQSTQEEIHGSVAPSAAVITKRTAEIAVGIVVAAFAMLAIVSNYQLGAGWAEDGPQAGYFPLRMGVAILLASIVVIIQALRKNDRSAFLEQNQLKLVATVLLPLILYIAALQFIGVYVASALFIGIFMWLVGKFSWYRSAITGVSVSLVLFWIFEIMFTVPLPKGPLEQLFGY